MRPYDIFCEIFDDDIFEHLIREKKAYASSKNHPEINITKEKLEVFLSILILCGYTVPLKRKYWDAQRDLRNEFVYTTTRRDLYIVRTIIRLHQLMIKCGN